MKTRFLTFAALVLAFTLFLNGCSQAPQSQNEIDPQEEPREALIEEVVVDDIPEDYEGVWLRTALYINGALEHQTPATLTLGRTSYTSVGTCSVAGDVVEGGEDILTLTMNSTNCPGASAGGSVIYTYTMEFDKERDVEVMTTSTANIMETYDRQS